MKDRQRPFEDDRELSPDERRIRVPILTRVEGEGGLYVRLIGNEVQDCKLSIYEPPRLFESLLKGRHFDEVADFTARICGICPIAYQMTAVQALENAMNVQVSEELRRLRRLIYYAEWIESHTLHVHLLHAPDFFECHSGMELAQIAPEPVKRGLRMKKFGNRLLEVLGGRAIHPVNLAVGGFYRLPRRQELTSLIPDFEQCLADAIETVRWTASLPFPDFDGDYRYVSLIHDNEYPITSGQVACSSKETIDVKEYEKHFVEHQVEHSTALQSYCGPQLTSYFVGPMARIFWNFDRLSTSARRVADEVRWIPTNNPYHGIIARSLEVVHAFEESLAILRDYDPRFAPRTHFQPTSGEGCSATEAPRGLIYHRYVVDDQGRIEFAKIVPPTSQNQSRIEQDLRMLLPRWLKETDDRVATHCERLVRNYDPCISCSTHFLKLKIDRFDPTNQALHENQAPEEKLLQAANRTLTSPEPRLPRAANPNRAGHEHE